MNPNILRNFLLFVNLHAKGNGWILPFPSNACIFSLQNYIMKIKNNYISNKIIFLLYFPHVNVNAEITLKQPNMTWTQYYVGNVWGYYDSKDTLSNL